MTLRVTIVDYGMGNLWSVMSAVRYLGAEPRISGDAHEVAAADCLILPGVGSFSLAMQALEQQNLVNALREAVLIRERKILGICLGMQLFAAKGTEDGECSGLGFIPGIVERFRRDELGTLKLPHIGFNEVTFGDECQLFRGLSNPSDFYFVHSYRLPPNANSNGQATCRYGIDFLAAYERGNIYATQFHPEKSQTSGLHVLKSFLTV